VQRLRPAGFCVALTAAVLVGCDAGQQNALSRAAKSSEEAAASDVPSRPNILLIVADDLGYTDLGAFGSEIDTPNLDALAGNGVRFSQFYTSPMCSPTRAMLLSGMDNHRAGVGTLHEKLAENQRGQRGFEGYLPERVATLPELFRDAGYRTYMTGKWHLGEDEHNSPAAAGFERSFALIESGAGHFSNMLALSDPRPAIYREDGRILESLPEDFYSTRFYAEKLVDYIAAGRDEGRPFFAYLAFTAPHFPLQAPASSIAKYQGKYDAGYDDLHRQRLSRLEELGLVAPGTGRFPALPSEKPWAELDPEERKVSARRMEIYAAMVDDLDTYVGRVIAYLKEAGDYRNTLIFFLSDNGAEGHWLQQGLEPLHEWSQVCCDNSYDNMGMADSYVMLGPAWARAATGPYRLFKGFTSEGGIRVPAFAHFPGGYRGGATIDEPLTAMDVMPTLLDAAGIEHPAPRYAGRQVLPMQGRSLAPMLGGATEAVQGDEFSLGWEFLGKRAYRSGDWKIVFQPEQPAWEPWPGGIVTGRWQLYNLAVDPAEQHDLADEKPQKRDEMVALWEAYAQENWVIHPDRISGY
jgi:arylsulfatase